MTALTVLLLAAALAFGFSRLTGIHPIPLFILAGFAAGLPLDLDSTLLGDALILGVSILVFAAGVELNPARVGRQRRAALVVGSVQFALLGIIGVGVGLLLGLELEASLYLGLALTASSTLVVVRILQKRSQLFEPLGRMITGVLLLQDLLIILLIPIVVRIPDGAWAVGEGVVATLALVALTFVTLQWIAPFVLRRLASDEESLLLLVLTILFAFMGLTHWLDLPLISGAFLAGVALSAFPVNAMIRGQLTSISNFFNALFFTALGAFLPFPGASELVPALLLTGLLIVVTPPIVALLAERFGLSSRPALNAGLVLAQTSEFSLVVGLQAVAVGQMTDSTFSVIVWVTVLSMALTPFITTHRIIDALVRFHPTRSGKAKAQVPVGHVVVVGCGKTGMELLEILMGTPRELLVIEVDPATVDRLREAGIDTIRGDISNPLVLRDAGVRDAHLVISTVRSTEDHAELLSLRGEGKATMIRTFEESETRWVEDRGAIAVPYSEAAAEEFMKWFTAEDWSSAK